MYCHCGKVTENKDTGECASCGNARRKAERMQVKKKTPIRKVSDKREAQLNMYAPIRERFLLGRWCAVHGKPCLPTEIHHSKGRYGYCDIEAQEKGIPALLDVRYFVAVCSSAHREITENSKWALEQGYSQLRTEKK
jgi:hypothetical protein